VLRALLALLAIAICGWFFVGIREARDVDRATALLSAGTTIERSDGARVSSLLDGASLLNPDRQVDMLRARLDDERGRHAQAERVLRGVVSAEPMNVAAWALVAQSATNGATLRLAYARIEVLEPQVSSSHRGPTTRRGP
jgi:hypothetical protein